ncbi:Large-conductance mechanosensitive channel [Porphyromonas crevioricanis]|uniref:Large-conductance mechanosensitive channel n=1 Tax=Porphyromonas crevioricanis TaxID=393921 RepID=A0A2X4SSJ7_9PORP|nr:large-conductance mechanosensitive channel protein MscL [Porphyromonas crevioricanis]GAD06529.1 large-conductance mechanosensitive channel [Porphyromonas crevioricanis JCM 13913]SQH72771.1 Large-conductance mechanosensitive channel [Porphyromonas crevioricanis]
MGFIKEFKEFAMKGNVMDMAVGIIIGGALGKIVSSLVEDVIMPPVGMLLGNVNFSDLRVVLRGATVEAGETIPEVAIRYGAFLQTAIDFLIIALAIFLMIKAINKFKRKEEPVEEASVAPAEDIRLLSEIRDLLKKDK